MAELLLCIAPGDNRQQAVSNGTVRILHRKGYVDQAHLSHTGFLQRHDLSLDACVQRAIARPHGNNIERRIGLDAAL